MTVERINFAIADLKEIAAMAREDVRDIIRNAAQMLECAKSILSKPLPEPEPEKPKRKSEAMEGGSRCTLWRNRTMNRRNKGQALVEYALILALISIVSIAILTDLGERVRDNFTTIHEALDVP